MASHATSSSATRTSYHLAVLRTNLIAFSNVLFCNNNGSCSIEILFFFQVNSDPRNIKCVEKKVPNHEANKMNASVMISLRNVLGIRWFYSTNCLIRKQSKHALDQPTNGSLQARDLVKTEQTDVQQKPEKEKQD